MVVPDYIICDGFGINPSAALRCILRHCDVQSYISFLRICTPCIWTFSETVTVYITYYVSVMNNPSRDLQNRPTWVM